MIDKKVLDIQIENLSKFLSKFSIYFSKNKLFINEVSKDEISQGLKTISLKNKSFTTVRDGIKSKNAYFNG